MKNKAHFLPLISLCAFLVCSCDNKGCNHNYGFIEECAPTFYEDGNEEFFTCSKCHKYFDKDKNEISEKDTVKKLELFYKLDKTEPQMMFGKDISISYKAEETQALFSEGAALIIKINNHQYTAIEANNYIVKLNNRLSFVEDQYYKASILADAYAGKEDYETKNLIYNDLFD